MREYIEENLRTYDKLAGQYLARHLKVGTNELTAQQLAGYSYAVYRRINKYYPQKVLELGPGVGGAVKAFMALGCAMTAIEFSPNMSQIIQNDFPKCIVIRQNILECDSLPEKQYDIIFANAFIHLFPVKDEKIILDKIDSWLAPDGMLFLNTTIHETSSEGYFIKEDYDGRTSRFRRQWEKEDFIRFLRDNRFEIIDSFIKQEPDRDKVWINVITKHAVSQMAEEEK